MVSDRHCCRPDQLHPISGLAGRARRLDVRRDCAVLAELDPHSVVPAIFFIGQSVADYVLSPYFVGRRVNLNPVWVMFALFAFGYLFGFVGLLIAVPLAAAIGVLMRFALQRYYASPLYAAARRRL